MIPTLLATPLVENTSCNTLPPEGAVFSLGRPGGKMIYQEKPWHA
jgi:hypothetical protein